MAYSYIEYIADGLTNQFAFAFPYIEQSHIKVYLDGEATTAFTFVNASTIQTNVVPESTTVVKIARETPKGSRLVNFTNVSMLRESTLDKDSNHLFFVMQEVYDSFQDLLPVIETIGELLEYGAASLGSNTFTGDQEISGDVTVNGAVIGAELEDVTLVTYGESEPITPVGTSGTVSLDLSTGNVFAVTVSGGITFQFTNPHDACSFTLILTNGGTNVTWPSGILWPQGVAPTLSTDAIDILTFFTFDGGTSWFGGLALDACA
jgi:hypothetical protein